MHRSAIAILSVAFFLAVVLVEHVSALDEPRIVSVSEREEGRPAHCSGERAIIVVEGFGETEACQQGSFGQVAQFHDGISQRIAYRPWSQEQYSLVEGVCGVGTQCLYSESENALIQKVGYRIEVIREFSASLEYHRINRTYVFTQRAPGVALQTADGTMLDGGAIAISAFGNWLAVEIRNKGLGVVDLSDLSLRRLTAPGYRYGVGMDPRLDLAVSSDGTRVIATGLNAGFTFVVIDETCGEVVTGRLDDYFPNEITACAAGDVGIGNATSFRYGFSPKFIGTHQAFVYVIRADGTARTVKLSIGNVPFSPLEYLALGDSYTSGEGESDSTQYAPHTNEVNERCHLSLRSYPYLVGIRSAWGTRSVACSGARIQDVFGSPGYNGQNGRLKDAVAEKRANALDSFIPGRIPQMSFVEWYGPKRMTVSVGGNDSGIMDKLKDCAMPGDCDWVRPDRRYVSAAEIDRLGQVYRSLFAALRQRAPSALVSVVGYPLTIVEEGECDLLTGVMFSKDERAFMIAATKRLNSVMETAARASGVTFIDIAAAYNGYRLCQAGVPSAMNALVWGSDIAPIGSLKLLAVESFHPTFHGHALVERLVSQSMQGIRWGCASGCEINEEYWRGDNTRARPRAIAAQIVDDPCHLSCLVDAPVATFEKGSTVRAVLNSTPIELGTWTAREDGSLSMHATVPGGVASGYHALHLYGIDATGKEIDVYQTVEITERVGGVGSVLGVSHTNGTGAEQPTLIGGIQESATTTVRTKDVNNSPHPWILGDTSSKMRTPVSSPFQYWWLVVVFVAIGIMTTWLIFERWLKK